jgi:hypothetical protein
MKLKMKKNHCLIVYLTYIKKNSINKPTDNTPLCLSNYRKLLYWTIENTLFYYRKNLTENTQRPVYKTRKLI